LLIDRWMADRRRARAYSASPHDLKMRKNFFIQSIARARRSFVASSSPLSRRVRSLRDTPSLRCVGALMLSPTRDRDASNVRTMDGRIHPFRTRGSSTFPLNVES
jgi:hypothetical protein